MKYNKILLISALGLAAVACTKFDEILPEGGTAIASQVQEINSAIPERSSASFNGMLTDLGYPDKMYSSVPDDWEFLMILFCNDLEGADALIPDSGYNWFSVCGEYTSRNANYRNPAIRYRAPYNMIGSVNTFVSGFSEDESNEENLYKIAQAKCLRAYSYLELAPNFQFVTNKSGADIPLLTPATADPTNNPRATVQEVYDYILQDLTEAIAGLEGYNRPSKANLSKAVAYGLRARANLDMQNYQAAFDDAVAAANAATAEGIRPKSIKEVSVPSFYDISEPDWMWGYDMNTEVALTYPYGTTSSWLRPFSGYSYSAGCGIYCSINSMLWEKIEDEDIRKQWWCDADLKSTLLDGLTWGGQGDVANLKIDDEKEPFIPYTAVKFGCRTLGTKNNDEDMPLMRIDEMILIAAECLANGASGSVSVGSVSGSTAKDVLESYVRAYRNPSYNAGTRGLNIKDEIWFQRRIELWGEGFGILDTKRLGKPLVRFKDDESSTNMPAAFRFNMAADDAWLLMRFPQGETNTNLAIVDNTGSATPTTDQNPKLRDGVTD